MYWISRAFYSDELVTNSIRKHNISYTSWFVYSAKARKTGYNPRMSTVICFVLLCGSFSRFPSLSFVPFVSLAFFFPSCCWWKYVCACTINYASDDLQIDYYPFKSTPMHGSRLSFAHSQQHQFFSACKYIYSSSAVFECALSSLFSPYAYGLCVCVLCDQNRNSIEHTKKFGRYFWLHYCRII